jgi:hypothetical protein
LHLQHLQRHHILLFFFFFFVPFDFLSDLRFVAVAKAYEELTGEELTPYGDLYRQVGWLSGMAVL